MGTRYGGGAVGPGAIEDATAGAGTRSAVIGQGDIAYAQSHGTLVALAAPARVEAMTGWRDGLLVFDNQRLGDAVADFNRYTNRPIRSPILPPPTSGSAGRSRSTTVRVPRPPLTPLTG